MGALDGGLVGGIGGMIGEAVQDGLGAGLVAGILHGLEGLPEGGEAEISLALVTIEPVEEGGQVDELVPGIHEVEVEDVGLGGHGGSIDTDWRHEK